MPLKDFVNYSFSEALKANYVQAPGLPGPAPWMSPHSMCVRYGSTLNRV
jgi:hypothetical protein